MTGFETIVAFLAGLLIGSFLNVCIYRLPRDLSVVAPRSYCPHCERTIAWYDNIPVLSFLILRGRCRHCGKRISIRYPLVELATAIAFATCAGSLGASLAALKWSIFSALLIALIAADLEERILPDEFTLGGTALGLIFAALSRFGPRLISLEESALGAVIASGAMWLVGWLYKKVRHREGLGLGDVKMLAMMGAFLGISDTLLALIAGSAFGVVAGLAYILITRKDPSTYQLPFGTFLGAAALAVALWGVLQPQL
jgi:leader peptidase (prepilin peptidase) / N-methyltransferase